jgi:hypothetical protein
MDATNPPQIVFEESSPCADAPTAGDVLRKALDATSAPRAGWAVSMRVTPADESLRAEGNIHDEKGMPVARRVLTTPAKECTGLARAIGVWAQLVLDAERERAKNLSPVVEAALPAPTPVDRPVQDLEGRAGVQASRWDVGASPTLLMAWGPHVGGLDVGGTGFLTIGKDFGAWVRIGLTGGSSVTHEDNNWYGGFGLARLELCGRAQHIFQTDAVFEYCGGPEIGFHEGSTSTSQNETVFLIAAGPSVALRGELLRHLWLETRAVGVVNAGGFITDPDDAGRHYAILIGRLELGLGWRIE